jgi:DNA-binding NtrC family response regulator
LLETARRGTLFLADVHRLAPDSQGKLARALVDASDVRVMASGPTDLSARGSSRRFRPELLARLEATRIDVPALRDRRDDIRLLVDHFLDRLAAPEGLPAAEVEDGALRLLKHYDWPGNVAELETVLSRFTGERLTATSLPAHLNAAPPPADLRRSLAEWEVDHIRTVLTSVGGNKTRAAGILGIDRKTLRQKLR